MSPITASRDGWGFAWQLAKREMRGSLGRFRVFLGALLLGVAAIGTTLCPRLLGGPHAWLPLEAAVQAGEWCLQEHRCLEGEELLLRYRRVLAKL